MFVNSFQPYANYCFSFIFFTYIFVMGLVLVFCVESRHTEDTATVAIQLHFCNQTAMWPDNVQLLTWPEQTDRQTDTKYGRYIYHIKWGGIWVAWYILHKFVTFQFSIEFLGTAAIVRTKLGPCHCGCNSSCVVVVVAVHTASSQKQQATSTKTKREHQFACYVGVFMSTAKKHRTRTNKNGTEKSLQFSPRFVLIVALAPCFRCCWCDPLSWLVIAIFVIFSPILLYFFCYFWTYLALIGNCQILVLFLVLWFHQWHEAILINRKSLPISKFRFNFRHVDNSLDEPKNLSFAYWFN